MVKDRSPVRNSGCSYWNATISVRLFFADDRKKTRSKAARLGHRSKKKHGQINQICLGSAKFRLGRDYMKYIYIYIYIGK